jgi:pyochelin biosynthesis protein PchC
VAYDSNGATARWLRRFGGPEQPSRLLVCFPHAGGGASAYRGWQGRLPPDVLMYAVRYPGHHDRSAEACHHRMEPLAEAIAAVLDALPALPLALFGHSMGASLAFEVAYRLEQHHGRKLATLFVSGSRAPHLLDRGLLHLDNDDDLISYAVDVGGSSPVVFADPDLRARVLPPLRADHEMLDSDRPPAGRTIGAPIVGYLGDRDPEASPQDLLAWSDLTRDGFDHRVFGGGHFYLAEREPELVTEIAGRL